MSKLVTHKIITLFSIYILLFYKPYLPIELENPAKLNHTNKKRHDSQRSGSKCLASRNKAPSTKIIFQIFVDGALFSKRLLLFPPFIRF
ncbi:hypothetical protein FDP51_03740 [Enterococcus mundtii]|nr:hypothetical protein [Enterococcus mundtii]